MSHRQYLGALAWQEAELNRPNRTDHYLMLLAQRLMQLPKVLIEAYVTGKIAWPSEPLSNQKVSFETREQETSEALEERRRKDQETLKALWGGYLQGTKPQRWSEASKKKE